LTNSSGTVTATFKYDAAGNVIGVTYTTSSPPPTVDLYDQQQFDVALGQYQMRARIYDPLTGGFDSMDPLAASGSNSTWENAYIYADDDFPNMDDPTGLYPYSIRPVDMGKFVSNYIGKRFEAFDDLGGSEPDGVLRFGNRAISTIIFGITGDKVAYNRPRPDLVQANRNTNSADVYEIKAGSIAALHDSELFEEEAEPAEADVEYYIELLTDYNTPFTFEAGTSYLSGVSGSNVQYYPDFPLNPPGYTLAAFDNYTLAPGAILWDFAPNKSLGDYATEAAEGVALGLGALGASQLSGANAQAQNLARIAPQLDQADVDSEEVADTVTTV
jgi:RHS repeat-associated protein